MANGKAQSKDPYNAREPSYVGNLFSQNRPAPEAPVGLIGVLRLSNCFASRRSCCTQDDSCYTFLITRMRTPILLAVFISMSALALPQNLPAPPAISDPKLITSTPNANVEQNQQSLS